MKTNMISVISVRIRSVFIPSGNHDQPQEVSGGAHENMNYTGDGGSHEQHQFGNVVENGGNLVQHGNGVLSIPIDSQATEGENSVNHEVSSD